MIRWLWPILATAFFTVGVSAMSFDRINHAKPDKEEWEVLGTTLPLSSTADFYLYAPLVLIPAYLACVLFTWSYARSRQSAVTWRLRLPPVGPKYEPTEFAKQCDTAVRTTVAGIVLFGGGFAAIHIFRHFLMYKVFDHGTKMAFHDSGLWEYLTHWSFSSDLRYGSPNGVTYYAGILAFIMFAMLTASVILGIDTIRRVFNLRLPLLK